jgi:hypothetical protein
MSITKRKEGEDGDKRGKKLETEWPIVITGK